MQARALSIGWAALKADCYGGQSCAPHRCVPAWDLYYDTVTPCLSRISGKSFQMDTKRLTQVEFRQLDARLVPELKLMHFKMVGVGPNTINQAAGKPKRIHQLVADVGGHYLVADDLDSLRAAMHEFVDQTVDAMEKL